MTFHLGIDVGTTYTAAAVLRDGHVEIVPLGTRIAEIPSVVFLTEEGDFLVGEAAVRRGATEPTRLAREFKRRLGDSAPILLGGSPLSAQALTGHILRWVYDAVHAQQGEQPATTVVTCPANWGPFKRDLLEQALSVADLPAARTASEPEAAAVHYASGTRTAPGDVIAVYDLGGGTFDAAVLRKQETGFELLGRPDGLEHLGGIDFDGAVFSYVCDWLGEAFTALDQSDPSVMAGIARLRRDCVEAKEALSVDTVVSIPVLLPNIRHEIRLTRADFEDMIRPSLSQTTAAFRRALRSAGVEDGGVKTVVLVGGSSRIPLVGEMVGTEFGVPAAVDAHPKHSIALGAAMLAGAEAGIAPEAATVEAPVEPALPTATAAVDAPPGPAAEVPVGAAPSPSPGSRTRLLVGAVAGVVVAIIAAVALLSGGGGDDDDDVATDTTAGDAAAGFEIPAAAAPLGDDIILYTSVRGDNWDIFAMDENGGNEQRLTSNPARDLLAEWSPDRRSVAHTREAGDWGIRVISAEGGSEIEVTDELSSDARVAWSPDGNLLAFVSEREVTSDLYLLDLRTGELQRLTNDSTLEGDPAWSPDGTQLVLWRDIDGNQDLWILDVAETLALREGDGSDLVGEQLTDHPGLDADAEFSPDGTKLLFASDRNGNWDLFVLDLDGGGEPTQLTDDPADDQTPAWSPDGTRIAFESKRDAGDPEIYVMDADGANQRNLTNRPGADLHAAWASAGAAP